MIDRLGDIKRLVGARFTHFKGGDYRVERPVYDATDDEWVIGYVNEATPAILYTRTWDDFFADVTKARFTRVR